MIDLMWLANMRHYKDVTYNEYFTVENFVNPITAGFIA